MHHPPPAVGPHSPAPDCITSRLHLHEFVDGELDDVPAALGVRQLVAAHLQQCARCARLERQLRAMRAMLRDHAARHLRQERAPEALRERIRGLLAG